MATVNFLYRSTKDKAYLNLRLLFNYGSSPYVFGAKTKLEVSKHYWSSQHNQKRLKDIAIINKQLEVNTELNKIENHILNAYNDITPELITKDWLQKQIEYYYNPPEQLVFPKDLLGYMDFYINLKITN